MSKLHYIYVRLQEIVGYIEEEIVGYIEEEVDQGDTDPNGIGVQPRKVSTSFSTQNLKRMS